MSKMKNKTDYGKRTFQIFIVAIAIIAFAELSGMINNDLHFIRNILIILTVSYFIYLISISRILFGIEEEKKRKSLLSINHKDLNLLLIFSYFSLYFKDIAVFVIDIPYRYGISNVISSAIYENIAIIEKLSFMIGSIILVIVALFVASRVDPSKPSFLRIFHKAKKKMTTPHMIKRFLLIFFFLIAMFLFVFAPLVKLAIMIGEYNLILIALCIFGFIMLFNFKKKNRKIWFYKVREHSEKRFGEFIGLFYDKNKIFMAIGGIFVFNLLANFLLFMIPYFLGDSAFGRSMPITQLLIEDVSSAIGGGTIVIIALLIAYLLNIICFSTLMISPAVIWNKLFKRKDYSINPILFCVFIASVIAFLLDPIFKILPNSYMAGSVGVDVLTENAYKSGSSIMLIAAFALVSGIGCYLLLKKEAIKKPLIGLTLVLINTFVGIYLTYLLISIFSTYIRDFYASYLGGNFLTAIFFAIFMIISCIFYAAGFVAFIIETIKEYGHIHLSKYK